MELSKIIILFIGGLLSGLYGSSVGSGGLVSLPVILLTGLPIHTAIATNRFGVVFLAFFSTLRFHKSKKLKMKLGLLFGSFAALGSFIGSNLALKTNENNLKIVVIILFVVIFIFLMFKNKLGLNQKKLTHRHWITALILTFLLGIYGGFFGIGFGTFITFIFLLIGMNFIKSAAISRMVGLFMSLSAAIVFAYHGSIHYPSGIALGMGMGVGAWIGAGISVKKGNVYVRGLFLLILTASIIKLIVDLLG